MHFLSFNKTVYSDVGLTRPTEGPFRVGSTTELPGNIYFADEEYIGTGKNELGDVLWTVRFTYKDNIKYTIEADPDNPGGTVRVATREINIETGAIYDE